MTRDTKIVVAKAGLFIVTDLSLAYLLGTAVGILLAVAPGGNILKGIVLGTTAMLVGKAIPEVVMPYTDAVVDDIIDLSEFISGFKKKKKPKTA